MKEKRKRIKLVFPGLIVEKYYEGKKEESSEKMWLVFLFPSGKKNSSEKRLINQIYYSWGKEERMERKIIFKLIEENK